MEFVLKKSLESLFKRMETLKEEYLSEEKKLKESERLYSAVEIFNRKQDFRNKYINISENFVIEVAGYASVWVSTDEVKVDLTDKQKADNALWLSTDMMTLINCNVTDEIAFETLQRYFGDFAVMRRLATMSAFTKIYLSCRSNTTINVLKLAHSIKKTAKDVVEEYGKLLNEFKKRFKYSSGIGPGVTEALCQQKLLEIADLYEKYLNEVETAKTADFATASNFFI